MAIITIIIIIIIITIIYIIILIITSKFIVQHKWKTIHFNTSEQAKRASAQKE